MACSYVSGSSVSGTTATDCTFTAPASIQNDDILVIILELEDDVTPTPPSGFSQWVDIDHSGQTMDLWVWWKRASAESGSYTVSHASTWREGFMMAIRGAVASGDPADADQSENQGTGTTGTATGVTTTVDGDEIVYALSTFTDMTAGTPPGGTTPTFTERYDAGSTLYVATGELGTAGATGNKARSAITSTQWLATLVSVKALVAGGATVRPRSLTMTGCGA
jgi:hypothetical protein